LYGLITKLATNFCLSNANTYGMKRIITLSLASALMATAFLASTNSAHAQANLTFSGGSGTPLTVNFTSPITYTITTPPASFSPIFVFQGVGDVFSGYPGITTTLTYTINGGAAQTIDYVGSSYTGGDMLANDIYVYGSLPGVSVGDTVLLSAGALTTTGNIASAAPTNGVYTTFIVQNNATSISGSGISSAAAAPEPASLSLLALGGLGMLAKRRHKS
jgi:hypothetical protein